MKYSGFLHKSKKPYIDQDTGLLMVWNSDKEEYEVSKAPTVGQFTEQGEIFNTYTGEHANVASGSASHAEGYNNKATGNNAHAEGSGNESLGDNSHTEGIRNKVTSSDGHAEGTNNEVEGLAGHAEGGNNKCDSGYGHVEGSNNVVIGTSGHAEGNKTLADAAFSHAEGSNTIASVQAGHAEGKFNVGGVGIHEVGIGNTKTRKNAHTITTDGKHYIPHVGGYVGTESDLSGVKDLATVIGEKADSENVYTKEQTYSKHEVDDKFSDGSITNSMLEHKPVYFDTAQTLTNAQKVQARNNISAAPSIISSGNIGKGAVTTEKIADDAVTSQKIAGGTVNESKLSDSVLSKLNNPKQYKFVEYPGDNSSAFLSDIGITNHRTTILFESIGSEMYPCFIYYYPTSEYVGAGAWCSWVSPDGSTIVYDTEVDHTRYWSKRPTNFVTKTAFNSDKADIWRAIDDTNNDLDSKASFIADLQEQIEGNANNIAGLQTHIGDVEAHSVTHDQLDEVLYGDDGTMEEPTGGVYAALDYLYNERIEEETRELQRINDRINELDDVFVADYGVTPYEPVMLALGKGKVVVCKHMGADYSRGYALLTRTNDDSTYMQFAMVENDTQVRLFSLDEDNRWQSWVENYVSQNDLDDQLNIVLYGEDGTETNPTGGVYGIIGNIQSILAQINGEE